MEQRRAQGRSLIDLTQSNPTRADLGSIDPGLLSALADPRGSVYEPAPLGLESAREAVAEHWARRGVAVRADRVALTASTSEAYAYCFKLLCDPGDVVLVPAPSYPLLEELARYEGVTPRRYRLEYDGAWHVDLDSVREALGLEVRAILAVSPNNPTGSCLTQAELDALGSFGPVVIVDEVFAGYPLEGDVTLALGRHGCNRIVLDGLSKSVGLPQMKLAWMTLAGSDSFVEQALRRLEVMADAYLSVGTPQQLALPELLARGRNTTNRIAARLRDNVRELRRRLDGSPVSVPRIDAGWYAMLRLPAVCDEDTWIEALLLGHDVIAHPGWLYDASGGPWIVISLLAPPRAFREGLRRLGMLLGQRGVA